MLQNSAEWLWAMLLAALGIVAGTDYMGPTRLHVGFGPRAIWGAAGKRANAPKWLVAAVEAGWRQAGKV